MNEVCFSIHHPFDYCFIMRSRNFNYIGNDLVKEWESSYLKNNPQIKKGGSRNLEEIWEKEVFPKSNQMIKKLEKDCKSHIQKFHIFWDKVKEKEDLLFLNELIPKLTPNKLLGNEFDKMFHESLPDYVEIYETKKKEYLKEVDNWNTDKVEERKERLFSDEKINLYKYCSFWIWNKLLSFSYGQSISGDNPIND